jgi:flagellar basal-body rod protein FlgC
VKSRGLLFSILVVFGQTAVALEDNLAKSLEILARGSKFQSERLKIAAENIANEDSTSLQPGGDPYRRKVVFAKNSYDKKLKTNILTVRKFDVDKKTPFVLKYEPSHPAADLNGYVKYPNVQREIERADASEAQRSYEANLSIMEMSKGMFQRTLEVMK